ncbi:hypothetical protein XA68_15168 [Ophiocordyceps unilateralis]|uniref:Alpha-methylacyl-CoA racemase n=1 Tax=Ophiocordyceps unilateralis TaxID=268505 RepID=A0A2A9PME6_OPHUN|nr:hypothetical protein XA68_15168 [Ophiocordyceps unilateralis]
MATAPPPLQGVKVLEFAGLAPGPFAGMLLADCGATVLRVDRPGSEASAAADMLARGKASIVVDMGTAGGAALIRELVARAGIDVLIDPFRPGVLERHGLGPETLRKMRPSLVYARLTGFRRDGRYASMAGHDINYLAVSGVLGALGRADGKPYAPANLLGDFAGGGAMLVLGVLLALLTRSKTGLGQVVEANMVDGAGYLATFTRLSRKMPSLGDAPRGHNLLDGASPFYDTYETADGRYMSVGALEPRFFTQLIRGLGLSEWNDADRRLNRDLWPALRRDMAAAFRSRDRAHWESVFQGKDACCLPVLDYAELETVEEREGDVRAPLTLPDTPLLSPVRLADAEHRRRRPQCPRPGYQPETLAPGQGGEQLLRRWLGWEKGRHYQAVERGGLVLDTVGSKL